MRVLLKIVKVLLVAVVVLVLVLAVAGVVLVRRPFPKVDGTVHLPGLDSQVEIYRDGWGIPHIYADTDHDLFVAQGYVHAQDRLWQLELNRRIAPGRLAEVLGEAALADDRYLRALGMGRAAQAEVVQLDAESRAALDAYAAGINAYVAEGHALPLEFTILGFEPEPWTPVDSAGWGKVIAWDLANNRNQELLRVDLIARLGEEQMWALTPPYPGNAPLSIPGQIDYQTLSTRLLPQSDLLQKLLPPSGRGLGSNTWVIAGSHSTTGRPILANDPHLGIQMPSIWYEIGLHCRELNDRCHYQAVGSSFPGSPAVVIGHNPWIAWGMAAPLNDVQDWYVEKVNPDNPHQVEYQGQWEDVQVIHEEIQVKGWDAPDTLEVRVTRHGPIMSDVMDGATQVLALRWRALEPSTLIPAVLDVGRARDWDQFRAALSQWNIAGMNFVYADVAGNIGFQVTGEVPIRAAGDGLLPVPGWTGEYEWTGSIPFEEMPTSLNPVQGYFLSSNNRPVGDDYPYLLGYDWDNGYRARRVKEMLTARPALSPADVQAMHGDTLAVSTREIAPYLASTRSTDPRVQATADRLSDWDYRCDWDSVECSIFYAALTKLLRATYGDELGADLLVPYLEDEWAVPILVTMLADPAAARWFDDVTTPDRVETRDEILALALGQAAADLEERLGPDVERWQWGTLHPAKFEHILGAVQPLDLIFNRTIPVGGSSDTVNCAWFSLAEPYDIEHFAVSYRQIISLADWSAAESMGPSGQSGLPFHAHYDDMIESWRDVRYHPMLWTDAEVREHASNVLALQP